MADALSIALSGALAAQTRLDVSASNIANASSDGALPTDTTFSQIFSGTAPSNGAATADSNKPVYIPYRAVQTSEPPTGSGPNQISSGVTTTVQQVTPGYVTKVDPSASYANAKGQVAAPNVDLVGEFVGQLQVSAEFKANLKTTQTVSQLLSRLYDLGDDE